MAEATKVVTEEVEKAISVLEKSGGDGERLREIAAMALKEKAVTGNLEKMIKVADSALRQAERCTRLGLGIAILDLQTSDAYAREAKEAGIVIMPLPFGITRVSQFTTGNGWYAIVEEMSRQKFSTLLDVLVDECRCRPKGQE